MNTLVAVHAAVDDHTFLTKSGDLITVLTINSVEVRGAEAFDLLQVLNTGHSGSLSTIHADSAEQTLARFSTCVMMAGDGHSAITTDRPACPHGPARRKGTGHRANLPRARGLRFPILLTVPRTPERRL